MPTTAETMNVTYPPLDDNEDFPPLLDRDYNPAAAFDKETNFPYRVIKGAEMHLFNEIVVTRL